MKSSDSGNPPQPIFDTVHRFRSAEHKHRTCTFWIRLSIEMTARWLKQLRHSCTLLPCHHIYIIIVLILVNQKWYNMNLFLAKLFIYFLIEVDEHFRCTGECVELLIAGLRISALSQPPTDFTPKSVTIRLSTLTSVASDLLNDALRLDNELSTLAATCSLRSVSKVQINHLGLQDPLWNRKIQWGVS